MYAWASSVPRVVAGSSWPMRGRATVTIVESRNTMPDATTTASRIQRDGAAATERLGRAVRRAGPADARPRRPRGPSVMPARPDRADALATRSHRRLDGASAQPPPRIGPSPCPTRQRAG